MQQSLVCLETYENRWREFTAKFPVPAGEAYPSVQHTAKFGAWLTRYRKTADLNYMPPGEAPLQGLVRSTVQHTVDYLMKHRWTKLFPAFGAEEAHVQKAYVADVSRIVHKLHKAAAAPATTVEEVARAAELVSQTEREKRDHASKVDTFALVARK